MSETYYHVDRANQLAPGDELTLQPIDTLEIDCPMLEDLFPNGLSSHGQQYVNEGFIKVQSSNRILLDPGDIGGSIGDLLKLDGMYESYFELVRQVLFPEKPSRFQSIFGFETLGEAVGFDEKFGDMSGTIFEVSCQGTHKADMDLLKADSLESLLKNADRYWSGRPKSEDPSWELLLIPPLEVIQSC